MTAAFSNFQNSLRVELQMNDETRSDRLHVDVMLVWRSPCGVMLVV